MNVTMDMLSSLERLASRSRNFDVESVTKDSKCHAYSLWYFGTNSYSKDDYSFEEAQAAAKTLVNCNYCYNCHNCTRCIECRECRDCTDCTYNEYCKGNNNCTLCVLYEGGKDLRNKYGKLANLPNIDEIYNDLTIDSGSIYGHFLSI